ncbi:MAG: ATP-binding protein [Solirubrobacterales bacterium]
MSRIPIRLRLTIAFALATAVVIALAGVFVYLSVSEQLNDSIDETLQSRTEAVAGQVEDEPAPGVELGESEDPEDSFTQIVRPDGKVVESTSPALTESVLSGLVTAGDGETGFDVGGLPGVDGDARLLADNAVDENGSDFIVVAGAATEDRDETLSGLVSTFLIAAPLALLLASVTGYGLATVAMRPVERMRRQAGEITLDQNGERLPLPASRDEIHRLGETLNDMLDRIEDSLNRERSFVADASHELRTPLAIVRGELELGLRPDRNLAEARAAMASAQEEVVRLEGLTEDLLALARSDNARLAIDRTEVSIPNLLEGIRNRFEPLAEAGGRDLKVVDTPPATAMFDRPRIDRALGNLVENALRHGDGEVTLSGEIDSGATIFTVTDQGKGFPDDFAEEAFERFARAEAGRTTPGYGLGLAIVKAVAEAHGGDVTIEPVGTGAKVVMRIP